MKIIVTNTKNGPGKSFIIDDEDYDLVSKWRWNIDDKNVVKRKVYDKGKKYSQILARMLLKPEKGMEVDHINGNRLDNRRSNLRICTRVQNEVNKPSQNKHGFKGIMKKFRRWGAYAQKDGHVFYLGTFATKEEAARAYNKKAKELHGEFAWLNPV
jgi:hypothetical protein